MKWWITLFSIIFFFLILIGLSERVTPELFGKSIKKNYQEIQSQDTVAPKKR